MIWRKIWALVIWNEKSGRKIGKKIKGSGR
jgi:hypothetical protein